MDPFYRWIEQSWLSTWIGQSDSMFAFPLIITFHTLGMGLLVGTSAAINFRILGFARHIPLARMDRFFPVIWIGLVMNVISGILLLIAYPTKALTNPLFYIKLTCIGLSVWVLLIIRRSVLLDPLIDQTPLSAKARRLAVLSLVLWISSITSGRLLEYTYTRLMVDFSDRT